MPVQEVSVPVADVLHVSVERRAVPDRGVGRGAAGELVPAGVAAYCTDQSFSFEIAPVWLIGIDFCDRTIHKQFIRTYFYQIVIITNGFFLSPLRQYKARGARKRKTKKIQKEKNFLLKVALILLLKLVP